MKKLIMITELSRINELDNAVLGASMDHSENLDIVKGRKEEKRDILEARRAEDDRTRKAAHFSGNNLKSVQRAVKDEKQLIGNRIIADNVNDLSEIRSSVNMKGSKNYSGKTRLIKDMTGHELGKMSNQELEWVRASEKLHEAIQEMTFRKEVLLAHYATNPSQYQVIDIELDLNKLIAREQKKAEKEQKKVEKREKERTAWERRR